MCKLGSERIEKEMTWAITRQDFVITWRNLRRFHITLRVLFLAKFALGMLSFNMNSIFEEKEIKSAFGWLFSFLIYNQTGVSGSCDQDRMSLSWFLSVTCQNGRLGLNWKAAHMLLKCLIVATEKHWISFMLKMLSVLFLSPSVLKLGKNRW